MPDKRNPPPGGARRRRKKPPEPEWVYRQQVKHTLEYLDDMAVESAMNDTRATTGLRRGANGKLSARRPQPHLPQRFWATVYAEPVVQYGSLGRRLEAYRDRLRYLASRGLYDGPTELTFVGQEGNDDATTPRDDRSGA